MDKIELRKKVFSKIDELPTLPVVVPKLLELMGQSKSDVSNVTEAISHDPALTSKVLKVANSAYYGFPQGISDLERAVALLGFNMVKSLALSMGVLHSLTSEKKSSHFSQQGLWIHSLAVATVMRELGKRFAQKDDTSHLFVVGLLHDIGKVVLNQFFGDYFQEALEKAEKEDKGKLHTAEQEIIGFDHGEVGAILLERWKFPETIVKPIALHHKTEIPDEASVQDVAMIRIADALPRELDLSVEGDPCLEEIQEADLQTIGMKEEDLEQMKAYLDSSKEGIYSFFNAMK
ncbi:MAG: HDOD domain-containing protein [Deltaproteobacteria bacterium]|nr:HDOD domain-containing protein [Deltaproteobacteria bacterium]